MVSPTSHQIRPLRRVEYDRLVSLGTFQGERIELIAGELRRMSPIGPPHTSTVDRLNELLVLALVGRARVRIQGSFAAGELSEPEPDVSVLPLGVSWREELLWPQVADFPRVPAGEPLWLPGHTAFRRSCPASKSR